MDDFTPILKWIESHPNFIKIVAISISIISTFLLGKAFGTFVYYIQTNYFN